MKPRSYFGWSLMFPYVLWLVSALLLFILSSMNESEALNFILMPIAFYVLGVILWFLPYTVLAVGMWIWSRNKSTKSLWRAAMLAPFFLFMLALIGTMIVSLPAESLTGFVQEAMAQAVLVGIFSLLFGYLCVGVAAGVYKILRSRNLIVDETLLPES
jgi:hypothetical protein